MKGVIKVISMCFFSILSLNINAATIDGSFGINGALTATGTNLADVTAISLSTVLGTDGSLGDTSNVDFFSMGAGGSTESLTAALTGDPFFTIGGWSFQLTSLTIIDQRFEDPDLTPPDLLSLKGSGILSSTLSNTSFTPTDATWTFSTTSMDSYNMTVATVPVPAAFWLFGSGLIGLIGVARRKA